MTDKLVLYNAPVCPYAQRAYIALKEVGAEFDLVDIDLLNKPDWYKDVNPELKVPVLKIDGYNLAESMVIVEYINDRYPEKNLLPKDPLKRAQIRFAIEYFSSKVTPEFYKFLMNIKAENARADYEKNINQALTRFDELLKEQSATGPYFLGEEFSLADIAIAPFVFRIHAINNVLLDGLKLETVTSSSRLTEYIKGLLTRPSVKDTWIGEEELVGFMKKRFNL
ncbi:Glutathione S-transferase omega-2 [Choanephora cucurbitarum]|uniref:Glutathione S-transferase omega-2 n=1 Tax=Choanephora cucurbitarum TaxID=101091 RepID=A0A1C7NDL8_9FUNG|nr:Glutathione S-transferase omega-2 [Choanephora cucurbitarum]